MPFLSGWAKRLPSRYFAHIPDVLSFSAWAVAVLLGPTTPAGRKPREPKLWRPTENVMRVITLVNQGWSNEAIADKVDVKAATTAANLRKIRSRASKAGLLPWPKPGQRDAP